MGLLSAQCEAMRGAFTFLPYSCPLILNPCGDLPRGLPCVDTEAVHAQVDAMFDSSQSAAKCSFWATGSSDSVWLEETGHCFGDIEDIRNCLPGFATVVSQSLLNE